MSLENNQKVEVIEPTIPEKLSNANTEIFQKVLISEVILTSAFSLILLIVNSNDIIEINSVEFLAFIFTFIPLVACTHLENISQFLKNSIHLYHLEALAVPIPDETRIEKLSLKFSIFIYPMIEQMINFSLIKTDQIGKQDDTWRASEEEIKKIRDKIFRK